jgi:hypothetical protein
LYIKLCVKLCPGSATLPRIIGCCTLYYSSYRTGEPRPAAAQACEVPGARARHRLRRDVQGRVGKNPGLKKNTPTQWFFWFFLGFFGFFYIFAQKREFLGFFSFKNTLRCIQTLNYNHTYKLTSFSYYMHQLLIAYRIDFIFLSEIFLIEYISYYFL